MAKGKFIVPFLFLLLSVFSSEGRSRCERAFHAIQASHYTPSSKNCTKRTITAGHSFKAITRNDHLKVRYMGGDCSFDICPIDLYQAAPEFADKLVGISSYFLIPSHEQLLLSLRGPPTGCIAFV